MALGGNLGDTEGRLLEAIEGLAGVGTIERRASLYRTRPVSPDPQPDFLNTAVLVRTVLLPEELLAVGKALERSAGRRRGPRGAPRPLDVDLLLWGDLERRGPELVLPHPRLRERAFYLVPLAEIAPRMPVPPDGLEVAELAARVDRRGVVEIGWR